MSKNNLANYGAGYVLFVTQRKRESTKFNHTNTFKASACLETTIFFSQNRSHDQRAEESTSHIHEAMARMRAHTNSAVW